MEMMQAFGQSLINIVLAAYEFLWGDLVTIPLPGGGSVGLSLLILILVPVGVYFTIRTRFVLVRLFPEMLHIAVEKKQETQKNSISGLQALIVSTAIQLLFF